ncbi:ABC transporter substrate-binding protein [Bacillus sp. FJAT-50079]|uniref:ABC transporter substrate-binding protein n=1 Tax=Bacillus sp. FJAT-50079 TaxID=2833577 RepID=UPI001BC9B922|nr:ABC transporter substrate-binding protein [Bacillus sp. FJAT-50079]MBS4206693.1 extracellular solute-binding protein [Bacillus sp. FJAT-50079]
MGRGIKAFIIMVLLFLLLVGCSTQNKKTTSKENEEVTTISYLAHSSWEEPIKKVVAAFEEEHPNIKVDLQLNPYAKLTETIEIKLASKANDLDIISVDAPLTPSYALKGYLEPLEPLLGDGITGEFIQQSVDAGSYDGKLLAAPMNTSSVVLYYNKDLFEEKGIPFPSEDINDRMTWEQVVDLAKQLTEDTSGNGQTDVFGFVFDQIGRAYQLLALAEGKGAQVISDDGLVSEGFTNSEKAIEAYQFYYDLFNTWKVSPKIKREETLDYFISGKVAMFLGVTTATVSLEKASMNFGVAPHPYFLDEKVATPTGSWHMGISKYSTKKEAAAEFIKYVTVGNGAKIWFEEYGALPAKQSFIDEIQKDEKYKHFPDSIMGIAAYEASETAVNRPKTPGYLEWESNFNKALEDIKNGTEPEKALNDAVKIVDRHLQKYQSVEK